MITIHHLTSSRSERIVWLMEELGLEYRLDLHGDIVLAESGLMALTVSRIPEAKENPVRARLADRMARMLSFVDGKIAGNEYFAGSEFTAADVMMAFPFTTMRHFLDYDLSPYPNIRAYLGRIEARPAYRQAMAIAGPPKPP